MSRKQLSRRHVSWLAIAAAVFYNSWPLAYWLNPVSAHKSASQLEGLHQPYNWLFVTTDVLSAGLILLVCGAVWWGCRHSSWLAGVLLWASLFAAGTIVAALVPVHCSTARQLCPSFTATWYLLVHAIASVCAGAGLSLSLLLVWWHRRRDHLLNALLLGSVTSGVITIYQMLAPDRGGAGEKVYLTICSLWLALLPYYAYKLAAEITSSETSERQAE